jgi:predicted nucleotidyltransferase
VEGRQTYFQANRRCPIFDELRGLVRKTFGVSQVLADALAQFRSRILAAFLFGSVATGTESEASDIDLMVIGDVSLMEVVSAIGEARRELGRELNPVVYPGEEFGRKLAEGQHFIRRVVGGPRIFVIGDVEHKGLVQFGALHYELFVRLGIAGFPPSAATLVGNFVGVDHTSWDRLKKGKPK